MNSETKKRLLLISAVPAALLLAFAATVCARAVQIRRPSAMTELSAAEQEALDAVLDGQYPSRREILHPLPYPVKPAELSVGARSAIAVDAANGNILYEKNADEAISPASMTKLVVMYVVFEEIAAGRLSMDDVVPLPPESWACNMPPRSSLMFLGKGQRVTVEELLAGLAVCSGNDAAYALAYHICGGMEPFIARMNGAVRALGLERTKFVESSGYSELNTTTAREMAAFACAYLERHPEALPQFHSRLSFTYPQEHNLAPEDVGKPRAQDFSKGLPEHITMGIYQQNSNPLLGTLDGCDGLKTGYIDESGYNLALTARRKALRVLSVTMGGPGASAAEGNAWRVRDGTTIMEWAFATFADYQNPLVLRTYQIPLVQADRTRMPLVPAFKPAALTVPAVVAADPDNAADEVRITVRLPPLLKGAIHAGEPLGAIEYHLSGALLQTVPLVAGRSVGRANAWICAADAAAQLVLKL